MTRVYVRVAERPGWRAAVAARFDPVLAVAAIVLFALVGFAAAPLAGGVTKTDDTQIAFDVETSIAVAPGTTKGDTTVDMPDLVVPNVVRDADSDGWKVSSNWALGYDVRIRSSTDPALKGSNSTNGSGSGDYFKDFTTGGCPCLWDTTGFTKGVFGYSAAVTATSGSPVGADKWGTSSARKWRGFDDAPYTLFQTGGLGSFKLTLYFRSVIPEDAAQESGSYRANVYLSISPTA